MRRRKRRKKAKTREWSGNLFILEGKEREATASREGVDGKYKVMKRIKTATVNYNVRDDEIIFNKNAMLL